LTQAPRYAPFSGIGGGESGEVDGWPPDGFSEELVGFDSAVAVTASGFVGAAAATVGTETGALVGAGADRFACLCPGEHAESMNINTTKIYFFIFFSFKNLLERP